MRAGFPVFERVIRSALDIRPGVEADDEAAVWREFDFAAGLLADGRAHLCGERFTAADLTFASLAAARDRAAGYGVTLPQPQEMKRPPPRSCSAPASTPPAPTRCRCFAARQPVAPRGDRPPCACPLRQRPAHLPRVSPRRRLRPRAGARAGARRCTWDRARRPCRPRTGRSASAPSPPSSAAPLSAAADTAAAGAGRRADRACRGQGLGRLQPPCRPCPRAAPRRPCPAAAPSAARRRALQAAPSTAMRRAGAASRAGAAISAKPAAALAAEPTNTNGSSRWPLVPGGHGRVGDQRRRCRRRRRRRAAPAPTDGGAAARAARRPSTSLATRPPR